eukprot:CAMPEP_0197047982 /NCGR_PEP_ID=MMETSP1384-20130603/23385_1 /TAXON_ID=29189 /ORGANISM="Ammonia sp." /LENGTH=879 /DNA_ID=CAMNT_0042480025 /DNA_START=128 /DNA_END=2767 /DNA_ORIENTATION=+
MPKKGSKAALKKKQKKQQKAKNQPKQEKNKTQNGKNNAKLTGDQDVLQLISNPDDHLKEFIRDINIHNFSLAPIGGGPPLIRGSDIKLTHGHRYGLIGYNGAGKTTLLKALANGQHKEIPDYLRVLHVHQEQLGTEKTVLETVLASDTERELLLKEQERLQAELTRLNEEHAHHEAAAAAAATENQDDSATKQQAKKPKAGVSEAEKLKAEELGLKCMERLHIVQDRLKFIEADTAEARASAVLQGLCFTGTMTKMKTSDLSGGWRMRVSLACALFVAPDVLLLDEPTNHLDFPSVIWLTDYLRYEYPTEKTIMVVSHDRRFLNDVCTDIIHLDRCRLMYYNGNYDSFLRIRSEQRVHQRKQYERQQKMIKHNEEFIARFKSNKKWSTQAQSRQKLLTRMSRIEKVLSDLEFRFQFPPPNKIKNDLIVHLDDVTFGYYGEEKGKSKRSYILHDINLRVKFGEKIGILGANGAGKSTLIKLIMQELKPILGTAYMPNGVQYGYFAQHHLEALDYHLTPIECLQKEFGSGVTIQQIYAQLGRFSLGDQYARRKIGTLSGGQKSRVAFAILTWYSPHLIIMDEPTNHLDMPTIDALAIALSDFEGTVMVVSHDQHFVETVCDDFWCVGNRTIKVFDDFQKCREYSTKAKAPDILPRAKAVVEVQVKVDPTKNINWNKEAEDEKAVDSKKKPEVVVNRAEVFGVDPEREIDKGLEKGLTPNQILRHLKGYKPVDGNIMIVTKLGFIMFHDYFDDKSAKYNELDHYDFFEPWKNIINYCIPFEHKVNQKELLTVAVKCFATAKKDNADNKRCNTTYSFGLMLEALARRHEMVAMDVLQQFYEELSTDEKKMEKFTDLEQEAVQQINTFLAMAQEDEDDDESESD